MLIIGEAICRGEQRAVHGDHAIVLSCRNLLLSIIMVGIAGCVSPESIDLSSYDPAHDQIAIAGYYRNQAIAMHGKAHAQVTAAARYEALFWPEADLVSGARSLARYYEQTAQEFERVAEAHASVARTGKRPKAIQ
jgi:hypothetical protein